eukprot:GHVU01158392.1.p1 GENE.GHVU01158392.1~~GHVU01158392.1.p1  ORF type:complete len:182 (+),score=13.32 GHVU01158392.1:200-745(+)
MGAASIGFHPTTFPPADACSGSSCLAAVRQFACRCRFVCTHARTHYVYTCMYLFPAASPREPSGRWAAHPQGARVSQYLKLSPKTTAAQKETRFHLKPAAQNRGERQTAGEERELERNNLEERDLKKSEAEHQSKRTDPFHVECDLGESGRAVDRQHRPVGPESSSRSSFELFRCFAKVPP